MLKSMYLFLTLLLRTNVGIAQCIRTTTLLRCAASTSPLYDLSARPADDLT